MSLGGGGLPRGDYDRFKIATPPWVWVVLHDSPWGSRTISPGGGETPLTGSILVSPVGEGLPLWV